MKTCSKCKVEKELDHFHTDKSQPDMKSKSCKLCKKIAGTIYRDLNKSEISIKKKQQYYANQSSNIAKKKEYNLKNKDIINLKMKENYVKNVTAKKAYAEEYRKSHKEKNKQYQVVYRVENKDTIRETQYKWEKNELETNPAYRIRKNLRGRIRNACGRISVARLTSAVHKLLKDDKELMNHFERQWTKGMTWDNYGQGEDSWNTDHYIPFAYFDDDQMLDPMNQRIINHPLNLRPMWSKDNFAKLDSIPEDVLVYLEKIKKAIENE
jgi:hypothetical protein